MDNRQVKLTSKDLRDAEKSAEKEKNEFHNQSKIHIRVLLGGLAISAVCVILSLIR
jgi:hypothetical protein